MKEKLIALWYSVSNWVIRVNDGWGEFFGIDMEIY